MNRSTRIPTASSRVQLAALLVGILGGGLCAFGAYSVPAQFYPAYLVAFLFWLGLTLGCLAIVMLHNLTGGGWGTEIRWALEESLILLPLLAVLFIPLVFGMSTLYSWSRPEVIAADELLQRKTLYLNVSAFQWRAVGYFTIWILLAAWMYVGSRRSARAGTGPNRQLTLVSGPGLILWGLTVTFASIDWVMSLEPHWFSSMFGVLFMGAQGVSGLAFAILAIILFGRVTSSHSDMATARFHDLGNLLLAFILFWSYVSFMQYLIIWSGNLPEEVPWYLHRSSGGWQFVALSLVALHFVLPFFLLLSRETKRAPSRLLPIAVLLLCMRWVDLTWLVLPSFWPGEFHVHWLNFVAPLAIGGLWVAAFLWRVSARARDRETELAAGGTV